MREIIRRGNARNENKEKGWNFVYEQNVILKNMIANSNKSFFFLEENFLYPLFLCLNSGGELVGATGLIKCGFY